MTLSVQRTPLMKVAGQMFARGAYRPEADPDHEPLALPADVASAVKLALKAVEIDNINTIVNWQNRHEEDGEAPQAEPTLDSALAFEHLQIDHDGQTTHLVAMVTDSIYRSAYRLAYVVSVTEEQAVVELSEWDAYTSPLMVGPWMYLTEYFGDRSTLAFTEWADGDSPLRGSKEILIPLNLDQKIPTGFPAIDKEMAGGVEYGELKVISAKTDAGKQRGPIGGPIGTEWDEQDKS